MDLNIRNIKRMNEHLVEWKGDSLKGNVAHIIKPSTNKDYTNNQPAPFGKPRPLKHHRLGRNVNNYPVSNSYYQNILQKIMNTPSATIINSEINVEDFSSISYSVDYIPIINDTQNPTSKTCSPSFCCNEERKAIKRVASPNTNVKDKYCLSSREYLQKRCLTYEQNSYDFYNKDDKKYVFQCRVSTDGKCKEAFYNPSNQLFPVEGAVSNSNYTSKIKNNAILNNPPDYMKLMFQPPQTCI
jgi:hypothetical protein